LYRQQSETLIRALKISESLEMTAAQWLMRYISPWYAWVRISPSSVSDWWSYNNQVSKLASMYQ